MIKATAIVLLVTALMSVGDGSSLELSKASSAEGNDDSSLEAQLQA